MNNINDTLYSMMPCPICWCLGYLFAIPTLGCSLICMFYTCIGDAEQRINDKIKHYNTRFLLQKGLHLTLVKSRMTSWLEFRFIDKQEI